MAEWLHAEAFGQTLDYVVPVERKRDSFGIIEGRLVAIDYGGIDAPNMPTDILVRWSGLGWTAQIAEDFPHYEALETANDLCVALSFRRSAPDVVDRGLMAPHSLARAPSEWIRSGLSPTRTSISSGARP